MNPQRSAIDSAYAALCTIEIPNDWTPEQALAVWELLNELADRIWRRYEIALIELIRDERQSDSASDQLDLFDPNDRDLF